MNRRRTAAGPRFATTANANERQAAELSPTERLCRVVADWTGAPVALMGAILVQAAWIAVGVWTHIDPYPFVFLLTVSNVVQLILIFVIAVAQRQESRHDQLRAEIDHEAISHLLLHQEAQETLLFRMAAQSGIETRDVAATLGGLQIGPPVSKP